MYIKEQNPSRLEGQKSGSEGRKVGRKGAAGLGSMTIRRRWSFYGLDTFIANEVRM